LQRVLQQNPERGYSATFRHERCRGAVSFRDVHFAYPGREGTLKGASFDIAPGEVVALTGENGAGKSTLVSLLMRFYLPEQGQIALDGVDISLLNLTNMRGHIGYVPQTAFLFNATVKENIQFGLNCDLKKIEEACDLAQAREFISALPYGFDTQIGDHGVRLSGGQRQRIALARALLSDLPGEAAFVEACKTALVGRTVILITHRPASLALADRTLTVIDGKVVAASRFP
jgi:ATP-binding cassette subfamily B protein/subfamily B ATP-binding cassette protein MsbA